MKFLLVDNKEKNRSYMNDLLLNQQNSIKLDGLLEAPNRVMGAMLIEAINFDLVIFGGNIGNTLPDGTHDQGDGVSLANQLLHKTPSANVVLWSNNQILNQQFSNLFEKHGRVCLPHNRWPKSISGEEVSHNLNLIFSDLLPNKMGQNIKPSVTNNQAS